MTIPDRITGPLEEWVVQQRWFASKSREVAHLNVLDAVTLRDDDPQLHLLLVEARFPTGTHEVYQLPLGVRAAYADGVIAELGGRATLIQAEGADHSFHVPARTGRSDADVLRELLDQAASWMQGVVAEGR